MHDIVVIGGGPAGCRAATLFSKEHDVLVLEEHTCSGLPVQCTGLMTKDVIDMSGVKPEVLSTIRGAYVHFPDGRVLTVRSKGQLASLIDRADLDRKMADAAIDAGAEIRYGTRYVSHSVSENNVTIESEKETLSSELLIGADGHGSKVAASLGDNGPKEYVRGIQVDIKHEAEEPDMMTLRIGHDLAPGFFTWEIPFGDMTRIGLCSSWDNDLPSNYLKRLLNVSGHPDPQIVAKYSGKIPLGGRRTTFGDRVLLFGDAAGQVKPISGGGLYPMLKSSDPLKDTVETAFGSKKFGSKDLSGYEKAWKREVGKELSKGYRIRKAFVKFDDDDLNKIGSIVDREDIRNVLNDIDLDSPSSMSSLIMRNPSVGLRLLPFIMRAMV